MNYKQISKGIGWLVFSISFLVYLLTAESTVSFWDCGEFISAAYKLQITHPSGAPLYQLLGRVFSFFSFGSSSIVAFCINMLSAVSSAFCVLLTFSITTKLAEKIINPLGVTLAKHLYIAIWSAGVIASFTLAFSDTFWFSAVEAEVYSLSSLFTFLTFWAALKWEENKSSVFHLRWLLFIAFIVGLSIGVHLLNLLVIPAVVLLIYISVYGYSFFKIIKALILGVGILLTLQFFIIPGIPFLAFLSDKWAVNTLGFKIGSGAILFIFGVLVFLAFLIFLTNKYRLYRVNITLLCLVLVLIGYSSYMLVPIRAAAQPPININKPDNAASFLAYINRDQYGKRSLVHGPAFNAPIERFKKGKAIWRPNAKGDYSISDYQTEYVFAKEYTMWFPRMGNVFNENSVDGYVGWTGINKETPPSQLKNWEFFFKYQFLHMYIRYHMWNFAGRQNDYQGHGNAMDGNSESGIAFLDNLIAAPTSGLPKSLENKGKNHYYFLPLLLGLVGLFYHAKRQKQSFLPTLVLFLFTGVFLCFYLNVPPFEPRERDYAFVGSFQVFSIWVGLGAFGLMLLLHKWLPKGIWIGAIISFIASPFLLLSQNWDDHNRSNRNFAKDYAYNFLKDLAPNAIVFVHGDNDTYPLWYMQNVEGFRTDVRIINANLLGSDWGAFELTEQQYQSKSFALSLNPYLYQQGKRSIVKVNHGVPLPIKQALHFVANDSNTLTLSSGKLRCFFPSNNLVLESGDTITIRSTHLYRSDLAILDVVANNPNRPVYFSSRTITECAPFFSGYLVNEGLVNRLYINKENKKYLAFNSMLNWRLSGFDDKTSYIDYEAKKVGRLYIGGISTQLNYLIKNNELKKAGELAVFCSKKFPIETTDFGSYSYTLTVANALYLSSKQNYANEYINQLVHRLMQEANYYSSIKNTIADYSARKELKDVFKTLKKLKIILSDNQQNQKAMEIEKFLAFFAERNNQ
jgi:hypothetical protein